MLCGLVQSEHKPGGPPSIRPGTAWCRLRLCLRKSPIRFSLTSVFASRTFRSGGFGQHPDRTKNGGPSLTKSHSPGARYELQFTLDDHPGERPDSNLRTGRSARPSGTQTCVADSGNGNVAGQYRLRRIDGEVRTREHLSVRDIPRLSR